MPKTKPSPEHIRNRHLQGVFIVLLALTVVFGTNVALFTYQQRTVPTEPASTLPPAVAYDPEAVATHNTSNDCWISIDDHVYDITPYIDQGTHPGGQRSLETSCGQDVSDSFAESHSAAARTGLQPYRIGDLATE